MSPGNSLEELHSVLTEAEGNQTHAYIHVNSRRQSSESGQTEEQKIGQRPPEAGGLTWELPTGSGGGGHVGTLWRRQKVLYFALGGGYVSVYICEN